MGGGGGLRLPRAVVCAQGRRRAPAQRAAQDPGARQHRHAQPHRAADHRQDRKTPGHRRAGRHPASRRRRHGRPRRLGRRDGPGQRAGDAKNHHPPRSRLRQAGHRRHPDAREHDRKPVSHAGRGQRRGQRDHRRRRRGDVQRRNRRGQTPAGSHPRDGPHRQPHRGLRRGPAGRHHPAAQQPARDPLPHRRAGPRRVDHHQRPAPQVRGHVERAGRRGPVPLAEPPAGAGGRGQRQSCRPAPHEPALWRPPGVYGAPRRRHRLCRRGRRPAD